MATPCVASTWSSAEIPPGIRRPWHVLAEHVEDVLGGHGPSDLADDLVVGATLLRSEFVLEYFRSLELKIQTEGALQAFMGLPVASQRACAEVALIELSAYVVWRRSPWSFFSGQTTDFHKRWVEVEFKDAFVPENVAETLAGCLCFAPLLCDGPPPCVEPCQVQTSLPAGMPEVKPKRPRWAAGVLVFKKKRPRWAPGVLLSADLRGGVAETMPQLRGKQIR
jgi:hypothetical protein